MTIAILAVIAALLSSYPLAGKATWYDAPTSQDAAAGPDLRAALGADWRGQWVTVRHGDRAVSVQLTDWCACGDRAGIPTLLDLDDVAFAKLAPLSAGVIVVTVDPVPALPATDTID